MATTQSQNISYDIEGGIFPVLRMSLSEGNNIYSEAGAMTWMSPNITMKVRLRRFSSLLARYFTGEGLITNKYQTSEKNQEIAFTANTPGKIVAINLKEGERIHAQNGSFLCAEDSVHVKAGMFNIFAACFGGEGLFYQKIEGPGTVFLEVDGETTEHTLKDEEKMSIQEGSLAYWTPEGRYSIGFMRGGIFTWLFGGQGLLIGKMKGPVTVNVQSLPALQMKKQLLASEQSKRNTQNRTSSSITNLLNE